LKVHKITYVQRMVEGIDIEAILDYFCVSKDLKASAVDVRVKRGVEIGSNHHLVVLRLDKGKVSQVTKGWTRCKWRLRTENLKKPDGQQAYINKLQEKCVAEENQSVEEEWCSMKKWLLESVEEAVGKKKCGGRGKSWWGEEIQLLVQKKKMAYKKWLNSRLEEDKKVLRELCIVVKEAVKEAKQKAWESFGNELQQDFYNNSKVFWKKVKGEKKSERVVLKNAMGGVISGEEQTAEWCKGYFEKLYNEGFTGDRVEQEMEDTESLSQTVTLNTKLELEPSLEEVRKCLTKLKSGKAAGSSGIVAEMLKAGGQLVAEKLWKFFIKVWDEVEVPKDWENGIIMPLFKKGDRMDLDNYRGITLMDVVGKVFSGILRDRLEKFYEGKIVEEQAGFRKGRGCVDQGFTLAQVVLKRLEVQQNTYLCFVDLKKAYDSVWRDGLFRKMVDDGVPGKLLNLVKRWYKNVTAKVRVNDVDSDWFKSNVGVRQGDTLSPLLFNIFINGIVGKVKESGLGVKIGGETVSVLLFADDMVLVANSKDDLSNLLAKVKQYCDKWQLEVNVNKTKVVVVSKDGNEVAQVKYGQFELECVSKYCYLGMVFSSDGRWKLEVDRRMQAGRAALSSVSKNVVWNKNISMPVKKVVFEALVKSKIVYSSEVWWASQKEMAHLETIQNDFIRWVSGYTRKDRMNVEELRDKVRMNSLEDSICCKRLEWLGHLIRMDGSRLVSKVWGGTCDGKRARGRPRWMYGEQEAADLARGGMHRWEALDREIWKRKVRQISKPR
jgi:hypothetical protein